MPIVSFSARDLLRGKTVTPAWYRVRIEEVGEAPAKTDPNNPKPPSTNYPTTGTILFNGDTGDKEFANVPLEWNFNSRAIGFAVGFLQAFGVDVKEGQRFDLKSAEGGEIDIFVENDTYQGRMINRVNHKYRRPKDDVKAVD
jgi:hypothetical protein